MLAKLRNYVTGAAIAAASLSLSAQNLFAQATGFDAAAFVDDVDVSGSLESTMTAMAPTLLIIAGVMLALAVVGALIVWARRATKAK